MRREPLAPQIRLAAAQFNYVRTHGILKMTTAMHIVDMDTMIIAPREVLLLHNALARLLLVALILLGPIVDAVTDVSSLLHRDW